MNPSTRVLAALLATAMIAGCGEKRLAPTQPSRSGAEGSAAMGADEALGHGNSKKKNSKKKNSKKQSQYLVTIENMTSGQPFSPPVAATHNKSIHMFTVRERASAGLEAIAEDGNQIPMYTRLMNSKDVTQAVDVGRPLTPKGSSAGGFSSIAAFEISARGGDRLSLATMLICTNDGFTGLDAVELPKKGSATYWLNAYDAGTEENTEASADVVDPCSGIGPIPLAGDPNGNEDKAVDTPRHRRIRHHRGIVGIADLSAKDHGWDRRVARVTIERMD